MKVSIIYWSGTGNTEKIAGLIKTGLERNDAVVNMKTVDSAVQSDVIDCDILLLGCPSMGNEVLEEYEFEPFMKTIESSLIGKKVGLFGSYDWGDGQWMRSWEDRVSSLGAILLSKGLTVNNTPRGDEAEKCVIFGSNICK